MKRKAMESLINWKNNKNKKVLFIFGAKNVGKTYLIKMFGKTYFKDVIYVNCESNIFTNDIFDENSSFKTIVKKLELIFNKVIDKENTLIFFDEIQNNDNALKSIIDLKCNEIEYYVTASISTFNKEYNFDKDNIETLTIYPLSFDEFLINTDNSDLLDQIKESYKNNNPLPGLLHKKAFDLYYDYLTIGGMPEVLNEYINNQSIISCIDYQNNIIESYKSCMLKSNLSKKIINVYDSIPSQLYKTNMKFQYKISVSGGTSNLLSSSIDWIINSKIAYKCNKIEVKNTDSYEINNNSFIIYMNDVGLLTNISKFPIYLIRNKDAINEKMLEMLNKNYVASSLSSNNIDLYYWKNNYESYLDFILLSKSGSIIPVEVKTNNHIKSRSLNNFMTNFKPQFGIKLSSKNFAFKNNIKYIPLYAAFCINNDDLNF